MAMTSPFRNAPKRVTNFDDLRPLLDLCKAGKLFEVQEWIAAGKPGNLPPTTPKGRRWKSPLEVAIECGFHSLVRVLLEGGVAIEPEGYHSPMNKALRMRRLDIAQLLVVFGYDPRSVDLVEVFDSWDPDAMQYFLERGADVVTGNPFAIAFCHRIRTALKVFKQCREQRPELQEQVNIALRHHCKEGNLKWASLMLWLGADPYATGSADPHAELSDPSDGTSALAYAAIYRHYDVFRIKQLRLDPANQGIQSLLHLLCDDEGLAIMKVLLSKGVNPNDQTNGGSSAIQSYLSCMSLDIGSHSWRPASDRGFLDTTYARDHMKAIHLLAKHGAKWIPESRDQINSARRSLLKLIPDYTVEFVWIISKFKAATLESIQTLLSTPSIKSHVAKQWPRLHQLFADWKS